MILSYRKRGDSPDPFEQSNNSGTFRRNDPSKPSKPKKSAFTSFWSNLFRSSQPQPSQIPISETTIPCTSANEINGKRKDGNWTDTGDLSSTTSSESINTIQSTNSFAFFSTRRQRRGKRVANGNAFSSSIVTTKPPPSPFNNRKAVAGPSSSTGHRNSNATQPRPLGSALKSKYNLQSCESLPQFGSESRRSTLQRHSGEFGFAVKKRPAPLPPVIQSSNCYNTLEIRSVPNKDNLRHRRCASEGHSVSPKPKQRNRFHVKGKRKAPLPPFHGNPFGDPDALSENGLETVHERDENNKSLQNSQTKQPIPSSNNIVKSVHVPVTGLSYKKLKEPESSSNPFLDEKLDHSSPSTPTKPLSPEPRPSIASKPYLRPLWFKRNSTKPPFKNPLKVLTKFSDLDREASKLFEEKKRRSAELEFCRHVSELQGIAYADDNDVESVNPTPPTSPSHCEEKSKKLAIVQPQQSQIIAPKPSIPITLNENVIAQHRTPLAVSIPQLPMTSENSIRTSVETAWSCPRCTLQNSSWRLLCEACYFRKGTEYKSIPRVKKQDQNIQTYSTDAQNSNSNAQSVSVNLYKPIESSSNLNLLNGLPQKEDKGNKLNDIKELVGDPEVETIDINQLRKARLAFFEKSYEKSLNFDDMLSNENGASEDDIIDNILEIHQQLNPVPLGNGPRNWKPLSIAKYRPRFESILEDSSPIYEDIDLPQTDTFMQEDSNLQDLNFDMNPHQFTLEDYKRFGAIPKYLHKQLTELSERRAQSHGAPSSRRVPPTVQSAGGQAQSSSQNSKHTEEYSCLLRKLELAIEQGNHKLAANLAQDLALRKFKPEPKFIIRVYVEDRFMQQGPFLVQVSKTMSVQDLKHKIQCDWGIPINFQKWIFGKLVGEVDERELSFYGVKPDLLCFLFLVTPDSIMETQDPPKPCTNNNNNNNQNVKNENILESKNVKSSKPTSVPVVPQMEQRSKNISILPSTSKSNSNSNFIIPLQVPPPSEKSTFSKVYQAETISSKLVLPVQTETLSPVPPAKVKPNIEKQKKNERQIVLKHQQQLQLPIKTSEDNINLEKNSFTIHTLPLLESTLRFPVIHHKVTLPKLQKLENINLVESKIDVEKITSKRDEPNVNGVAQQSQKKVEKVDCGVGVDLISHSQSTRAPLLPQAQALNIEIPNGTDSNLDSPVMVPSMPPTILRKVDCKPPKIPPLNEQQKNSFEFISGIRRRSGSLKDQIMKFEALNNNNNSPRRNNSLTRKNSITDKQGYNLRERSDSNGSLVNVNLEQVHNTSEFDKPTTSISTSKEQKEGNLQTYLQMIKMIESDDLVTTSEVIECPICLTDVQIGEGVVLRDCLHNFCKECLVGSIQYSDEPQVKCPYRDHSYSCESIMQEREIKALVPKEIFERLLAQSIKVAESRMLNSFHCKTHDCPGWCVYEDDVNTFNCPVCKKSNCLTCRAIHEGRDCRRYQRESAILAETDEDAKSSRMMLEKMLMEDSALECPACHVVLLKKWGCDWVRCTYCKTEICWITKGFRWGPNGKGDTSAGCRCGVNGIKCHPKCTYCH